MWLKIIWIWNLFDVFIYCLNHSFSLKYTTFAKHRSFLQKGYWNINIYLLIMQPFLTRRYYGTKQRKCSFINFTINISCVVYTSPQWAVSSVTLLSRYNVGSPNFKCLCRHSSAEVHLGIHYRESNTPSLGLILCAVPCIVIYIFQWLSSALTS